MDTSIYWPKVKSCKWCFNLKQYREAVKCKIFGWTLLCNSNEIWQGGHSEVQQELQRRAKRCAKFDAEEGEAFNH